MCGDEPPVFKLYDALDTDAALRAAGIGAFRAEVAELLPDLADDVQSIVSLDDVKYLDVRLTCLRRWHANGVLCIGDAAHAMSPAGGVEINLAIRDAVATARLLGAGALAGPGSGRVRARVRRRRFLTAAVQSPQRLVHARVIAPVIAGRAAGALPTAAGTLLRRVPALSVIPAFLIGIGPRPERAAVGAALRPAGSSVSSSSEKKLMIDSQKKLAD